MMSDGLILTLVMVAVLTATVLFLNRKPRR
jgi:hypothetical protein